MDKLILGSLSPLTLAAIVNDLEYAVHWNDATREQLQVDMFRDELNNLVGYDDAEKMMREVG